MKYKQKCFGAVFCSVMLLSLSACAYKAPVASEDTMTAPSTNGANQAKYRTPMQDYSTRLPKQIRTSERVVVVDPRVHAWGAYSSDGNLIKAGLATAGSSWCKDIGRSCRTKVGAFRVQSLGHAKCKSSIYPLPKGGAPMPYCMFFNKNQGLHGSYNVVEGNVSHGCVRLRVRDAEWLRFQFVHIGTKVIVRPY